MDLVKCTTRQVFVKYAIEAKLEIRRGNVPTVFEVPNQLIAVRESIKVKGGPHLHLGPGNMKQVRGNKKTVHSGTPPPDSVLPTFHDDVKHSKKDCFSRGVTSWNSPMKSYLYST